MKFPELANFDSDSVKQGLDALKIHVADVNAGRSVPFLTVGEYLADSLTQHVSGLVNSRITYQQTQIVAAELPKLAAPQLAQVGQILGKDLAIPVPEIDKPILARLGITSAREDAVPQPVVEAESWWTRMMKGVRGGD